ncbi:MAG: SGNH/GDSL hydrolase family protein [Candidatus Aminicenantes bacterium]|nr:SGNH/GDSL hydrolase family protein [Candidatus Aminicenantes bacterium]
MKAKILRFLGGIGVSLLSILVILLLLELAVRLTTDFKSRPRAKTHLPVSSTYRLARNPDLVYELLPGSRARVQGIPIHINNAGFRDRQFSIQKSSLFRVIVVGDSITYGWNVSLDQTFHKQLENRLRRSGCEVEVLGMGVVGYNMVQEYHLIRERALAFKPDLVVLQITPNDFERTVGIRRNRSGRGYSLLLYHDLRIPYVIGKSDLSTWLMRHSHFFRFTNLRLGALMRKRNPDYDPGHVFLLGEEKSFRYLSRIHSLLRAAGVPWVAVIFPEARRKAPYPFTGLHHRIHRVLNENGVRVIDLLEPLNAPNREDIWIERIHPNARGHALVADILSGFLRPWIRNCPAG